MKKIILILILVIFIIGCAKEIEESAKEISTEGVKEETKPTVKTEIKVKQMGVEMVISPSLDKSISGTVSIKATKVPVGTESVGFAVQGGGMPSMDQTGPNLGYDTDGRDGWATKFDTTSYDNGDYSIFVLAASSKLKEGGVLGGAEAKVTISNQAFAPAPAPKVAPPYKSLWTQCLGMTNEEIIEEAKEVKANTLWLSLIFDFDKEGGVVWTDPHMKLRAVPL